MEVVKRTILLITFTVLLSPLRGWTAESVNDIVQRSVQAQNADWAAAPQFNFVERDVVTKGGNRTVKTYRTLMIDGSPYHKLIAVNDEKVSPAQAESEEDKLQQEILRRRKESPDQRKKRIAQYERGRRQDHHLMQQMVKAFDFRLTGQERIDGRNCYVLAATPRPGYQPISRDTKVLKSMRGTLWVDTETYQWVKVHAEVFRPVAFGLFIAHVRPGTEFTLEQQPVGGNLWLPSHFATRVNARIVVFSRRSRDDETYSDYQRSKGPITASGAVKPQS